MQNCIFIILLVTLAQLHTSLLLCTVSLIILYLVRYFLNFTQFHRHYLKKAALYNDSSIIEINWIGRYSNKDYFPSVNQPQPTKLMLLYLFKCDYTGDCCYPSTTYSLFMILPASYTFTSPAGLHVVEHYFRRQRDGGIKCPTLS